MRAGFGGGESPLFSLSGISGCPIKLLCLNALINIKTNLTEDIGPNPILHLVQPQMFPFLKEASMMTASPPQDAYPIGIVASPTEDWIGLVLNPGRGC